jgi:hypothetical protein
LLEESNGGRDDIDHIQQDLEYGGAASWTSSHRTQMGVKIEEDDQVVKLKARIAAKGYVQKEGIDFREVFALW